MAIRVDLPQELVRRALNKEIQSITRAAKGSENTIIKQALHEEISQLTKAMHTLSETK
jgi:hypothetical protein